MKPSASEETISSDSSSSQVTENFFSFLQCYLCRELYKKPRILPCGHTFCSHCLLELRNKISREWKENYPLGYKRGEGGIFFCPMPGCNYNMKIMNLRRWSLRNRAASKAVAFLKASAARDGHSALVVSTRTEKDIRNGRIHRLGSPLRKETYQLGHSRNNSESSDQTDGETQHKPSNGENTFRNFIETNKYCLGPTASVPMATDVVVSGWKSFMSVVGGKMIGQFLDEIV